MNLCFYDVVSGCFDSLVNKMSNRSIAYRFFSSSSIDCLIAWWVSGPGERYRAAEMEVDGERQGCWQGYDVGSQSRFHATEEPVTGGQPCIGSVRGAADVLWAPVWLEDAAGNSPARGCRTPGRLPFISISFILRDTCLSVRPSVASPYCIETTERIGLFFWHAWELPLTCPKLYLQK